jgi:hypothetical protein
MSGMWLAFCGGCGDPPFPARSPAPRQPSPCATSIRARLPSGPADGRWGAWHGGRAMRRRTSGGTRKKVFRGAAPGRSLGHIPPFPPQPSLETACMAIGSIRCREFGRPQAGSAARRVHHRVTTRRKAMEAFHRSSLESLVRSVGDGARFRTDLLRRARERLAFPDVLQICHAFRLSIA